MRRIAPAVLAPALLGAPLAGAAAAGEADVIAAEARDSVHGWGGGTVAVTLPE